MRDPEIDLERALATLTPVPPAFTPKDVRAAVLLASQKQKTRLWQAIAAVLLIALATLAFVRPAPRAIEHEKIVYVPALTPKVSQPVRVTAPQPAPTFSPSQAPEGFAYLQMRQTILTLGIDALRPNRAVANTRAPLTWGTAHTDDFWPTLTEAANTAPRVPKSIQTPAPETKI